MNHPQGGEPFPQHPTSKAYPHFIPKGESTMFIEPETLAPIKNLENQIRLFVYDFTSFTCPHHFVLMTNLLTYVPLFSIFFRNL
ncbi:MAG: hypothetical protein K0S80_4322 [Neobacillus sp.]|nr:hypothetical protein [Neobacillus sp.]